MVTLNQTRVANWARVGVNVTDSSNASEALDTAGMNWDVELQPLYAGGPGVLEVLDTHRAVIRTDTMRPLGVVGKVYNPIQNRTMASTMDAIVGVSGCKLDFCGSLRGGRLNFMTMAMPTHMVIGPDVVARYLVGVWGHDGNTSARVQFLSKRMACQNQLPGILRSSQNGFTIRHTTNYEQRLNMAREIMSGAGEYFARLQSEYQGLLNSHMSPAAWELFKNTIVPAGPEGITTKIENRRAELNRLYLHGSGHENIRGTRWAAFQAVAEWVDHERGMTSRGENSAKREQRFISATFGNGAELKQRAFQLLRAA